MVWNIKKKVLLVLVPAFSLLNVSNLWKKQKMCFEKIGNMHFICNMSSAESINSKSSVSPLHPDHSLESLMHGMYGRLTLVPFLRGP